MATHGFRGGRACGALARMDSGQLGHHAWRRGAGLPATGHNGGVGGMGSRDR